MIKKGKGNGQVFSSNSLDDQLPFIESAIGFVESSKETEIVGGKERVIVFGREIGFESAGNCGSSGRGFSIVGNLLVDHLGLLFSSPCSNQE